MSGFITWWKKYWKWILFPIGILTLLVGAGAAATAIHDWPEPAVDLDEETQEHLRRLREAEQVRNEQLVALEEEKHEQLKALSEDQRTELAELQNAPNDEVVAWFANL